MTIIESTVALLFRQYVGAQRAEQSLLEKQQQKTRRILRNITDPAESVAECLIEQPKPNEHDTSTKAPTSDRR